MPGTGAGIAGNGVQDEGFPQLPRLRGSKPEARPDAARRTCAGPGAQQRRSCRGRRETRAAPADGFRRRSGVRPRAREDGVLYPPPRVRVGALRFLAAALLLACAGALVLPDRAVAQVSSDATLSGIPTEAYDSVADDYADIDWSPSFDPDVTEYSAMVPEDAGLIETVDHSTTTTDSGATKKYILPDGTTVTSEDFENNYDQAIELSRGAVTTWSVEVTAADGVTMTTYTFNVTRGTVADPGGEPAVSGAPQVGQTLTAEIGSIADEDGLPATFRTTTASSGWTQAPERTSTARLRRPTCPWRATRARP